MSTIGEVVFSGSSEYGKYGTCTAWKERGAILATERFRSGGGGGVLGKTASDVGMNRWLSASLLCRRPNGITV